MYATHFLVQVAYAWKVIEGSCEKKKAKKTLFLNHVLFFFINSHLHSKALLVDVWIYCWGVLLLASQVPFY